MSAIIRVLIVDDHAIVRQGLAAIINGETDMTVVGQAKNGIEAIALFRQEHPDVTLMDLRMPQRGGVEAISKICTEFNSASASGAGHEQSRNQHCFEHQRKHRQIKYQPNSKQVGG